MKKFVLGRGVRSSSTIIIAACAVIIVALAGLSAFFFLQYKHIKDNPNSASQDMSQRIISKVGKLYALPKSETPTVAAVKNKDQLKGQSFFDNAQNGDYILVYAKAKIAIIYRESINQIINIGPVSIDSSTGNSTTNNSTTTNTNNTTKTAKP